MTRNAALAIVGQQVLTEAWDEFVEQEWDHPRFGLSKRDWQTALESPFVSFPEWQDLQEALDELGGTP